MIITNKYDLPEALVKACSPNPHNAENSLSATTLKKGVREIILEKRHWNEMTRDVSEMIWALFGTAVHSLLETESPDTFTEEPFSIQVSNHTVTGRVDCYDMKKGIIYDYKTASAWKVIYNNFDDWHTQGMIYAWLLKKQGLDVKECRFIALLKDFSQSKARTDASYPQSEFYEYSFKVTEEELKNIEEFIFSKVKLVEENIDKADSDLPLCTEEERWAEPTKYAVMKAGRKTALKVCSTEEEAQNYIKNNSLGTNVSIEKREGTDKKCKDYCVSCQYCPYYKEHYETNE